VGAGICRTEGGVSHHNGMLTRNDVELVGGLPLISPARAVIETACQASFEAGVVTADSALHNGLVTASDLREALELARSWPGVREAGAVVGFADGRADRVGESRMRVLFKEQGLPEPELQVHLYDRTGQLVAIVDFLFKKERTVGEFDGRIKYGSDAPDVVFREKRREDRIRELRYEVVRACWPDLDHPRYTANRVRRRFPTS
ncbi:MAG: type IV toxin-antitoxin system AbiEi family antitoxin domain-containing protein, partial [Nocardioidaceae bacterium]